MMTKIKNINKIFIAISILFLILAIHPIFSSGIWTGSDWEVHAYRLSGVNYQISNHQFPLIFGQAINKGTHGHYFTDR